MSRIGLRCAWWFLCCGPGGLIVAAAGAGAIKANFSMPEKTVTLHEPVYVLLSINNASQEPISLDLGKDREANFLFVVTDAAGRRVSVPPRLGGGFGESGHVLLDAGGTYSQKLLLNKWYRPTRPGAYRVQVTLGPPPQRARPGYPAWSSDLMSFRVLPRDPSRLAGVCQSLLDLALRSADYRVSSGAAIDLSYIRDPIAVPYLSVLLAADKPVSSTAVAGLRRIATPEAVAVLTANLNARDPALRAQIRTALEEIRTGSHATVTD